MIKNPRGHSVVNVIAAIVVVIVAVGFGALGVGILAAANSIDCSINIFYGCPSNSSSTGGGNAPAAHQSLCSSLPNACGMTNNGTLSSCSSGTGCVNGAMCSATVPSNSGCPPPTIGAGTGFYANPSLVEVGSSTTLYWSTSNTTSCTVTGGPLSSGSSYTGSGSGSVKTGTITESTIYTLSCEDGAGGPQTSVSITVRTIPAYKEI